MSIKPLISLLLSLLLALALAACGGDEPTPTPTPAAVEAPTNTPEPATATPTAEPAASEALTETESVTGAETLTASDTVTDSATVTATDGLTGTESLTAPVEPTAAGDVTATATLTATASPTEDLTTTGDVTATETVTASAGATTTSDFVGTYVASLPAASSPGRAITLTVAADGAATMTTDYQNGEAPLVELGNWVDNGDGTATVTLTGQESSTYEVPVEIVFALDAGTLTATTYDQTLYGTEGLTLEKQAEGIGNLPEDYVGVYGASLPAASSPGRTITLTLAADGAVTLVTDYQNDQEPVIEVGNWAANDDGSATVILTGQADRTYEIPVEIVFTLAGGTLTATQYDPAIYGSEGLILEKQNEGAAFVDEALVGKWQLVRINYANDTTVVPDDPTRYTLEFMPDGQVAIQNDCNRGAATYEIDGDQLYLSPIAFTRALCSPESLFNEFAQNLSNVASYIVEDDTLNIIMAVDRGQMQFAPAS
jgi:heat shock protein HslJ/uncharacterized lipoprotein NlpE involved in copper resistance